MNSILLLSGLLSLSPPLPMPQTLAETTLEFHELGPRDPAFFLVQRDDGLYWRTQAIEKRLSGRIGADKSSAVCISSDEQVAWVSLVGAPGEGLVFDPLSGEVIRSISLSNALAARPVPVQAGGCRFVLYDQMGEVRLVAANPESDQVLSSLLPQLQDPYERRGGMFLALQRDRLLLGSGSMGLAALEISTGALDQLTLPNPSIAGGAIDSAGNAFLLTRSGTLLAVPSAAPFNVLPIFTARRGEDSSSTGLSAWKTPDGEGFAWGTDGGDVVFRQNTGEIHRVHVGDAVKVPLLVADPLDEGKLRLVAMAKNGTVHVLGFCGGNFREMHRLHAPGSTARGLFFRPNGQGLPLSLCATQNPSQSLCLSIGQALSTNWATLFPAAPIVFDAADLALPLLPDDPNEVLDGDDTGASAESPESPVDSISESEMALGGAADSLREKRTLSEPEKPSAAPTYFAVWGCAASGRNSSSGGALFVIVLMGLLALPRRSQ
jgi:hypothetical protein